TLIPTIVVPVCILGTFAMMSVLGFSVNMMTMFGMVLAIGILVDDAIVVVENVERTMAEEGLPPKEATSKAMGQISGAVIGITLVLAAVFLPLAFMDGSVGVIYRQFSMSVAVSIVISGFLALTLTPALCGSILKPIAKGEHHEKKGFFGWFNRVFGWITEKFGALTAHTVRRTWRFMLIYGLILGVLGYTYVRLPESFVPNEDQGNMFVSIQLPPGATHSRTLEVSKNTADYLLGREAMANVISVIGFSFSGSGQNAAIGFPTLKDWSLRTPEQSVDNEIALANQSLYGTKDGTVFAVNPAPVDGLGNAGGFSVRLQDRAGVGRQILGQSLGKLLQEANASPVIAFAYMEGLPDAPQLRVDIDREKAETLGLSFNSISTVLSTAFGSQLINEFVNAGRVQRVIVQADAEHRVTPESLNHLYVPNIHGDQVPLKAFARVSWESGPVQIARYNGFPAFKVNGSPAPGHSTGEAMAEIERIMGEMPKGVGYEWTGLSYQEKYAGAQAPKLFALALIVVFLLLVALYESWSIPFAVMLIVPIGALGSVLAVLGMNMANDVYFKVGLITIIGLSAKNAILIAEFARELMADGMGVVEAAIQAARTRFRPIIMTSMAFILGVLPLAKATGAGAASQQAIGIGVMGGMIAATILGVMFAPIFFVWVLSLFRRKKSGMAKKAA
ncbi:MAG: efflux RND transporter permease subunit, partial [Desulfobacterales bacterium]|nr:efflux RND transporter permease subunit [Desulfobacterales bacterium]